MITNKKKKSVIIVITLAILACSLVFPLVSQASNITGFVAKTYYDLTLKPLQLSELKDGLWYNPYMKIYTLGGNLRVMEISSYPRAYKDTNPHVYTQDTYFVVTEDDLNYYDENDNRFYQDGRGNKFTKGQVAVHYKNESLPGSFPLWIENESLPFSAKSNLQYEIDIVKESLQNQLANVEIIDVYLKNGTNLVDITAKTSTYIQKAIDSNVIRIPKLANEPAKIICYVRYYRNFK